VAVLVLYLLVVETYTVDIGRLDDCEATARYLGLPADRLRLRVDCLRLAGHHDAVLPTFLQVAKDFSATLATLAFASFSIVGIAVGPLSGSLEDRFDRLPVATGALVLSIIGIGGLLLSSQTIPILASVLVVTVSVRMYPPAMQAFAMERFSSDSPAGDFGALKTLYSGIGSLVPFYIGTVGVFESYWLASIGCVVGPLVSLFVIATLRGK
jgi:MFS family permease